MSVADRIFSLSRGVPVELADDAAPANMADGLAVQLAVLDRWRTSGETLGGWKIAFTSGAARELVGAEFHPFGYILESRIFASGPQLPIANIERCLIEPEICLSVGAPLSGPDVTVEEARAAVGGVAPAFEVNSLRLPGRPLPLLVADNLAQWGIVVGKERPADELDVSDTTVDVFEGDDKVAEQPAAGYLDDPYLSVTRLCATLDRFGLGLLPGQRVITGAFSIHEVTGASRWRADFTRIGSVAVEFR